MNCKSLIYILLLLLLVSCSADEPTPAEGSAPLVVEGWIEDGGYPEVMVSRSLDMTQDITSLDSIVQRWARVTVSDGQRSVILTGKISSKYLTGMVYTTNEIKGEPGKTYTLTVETMQQRVTAQTTIPNYVPIDSVKVLKVEQSDSLYRVAVFPHVDRSVAEYYKIFTRTDSDSRFYSSFLGTFSAADYEASKGWNAARGIHATFEDHFTPHYRLGERVTIKVCTMERPLYDFWSDYEKAVSLQGNMFFTSTAGCRSNIEGGYGYWGGYGVSLTQALIR